MHSYVVALLTLAGFGATTGSGIGGLAGVLSSQAMEGARLGQVAFPPVGFSQAKGWDLIRLDRACLAYSLMGSGRLPGLWHEVISICHHAKWISVGLVSKGAVTYGCRLGLDLNLIWSVDQHGMRADSHGWWSKALGMRGSFECNAKGGLVIKVTC